MPSFAGTGPRFGRTHIINRSDTNSQITCMRYLHVGVEGRHMCTDFFGAVAQEVQK